MAKKIVVFIVGVLLVFGAIYAGLMVTADFGKTKKEVLHWYFFPYQTVHCQLFERNHKIRQAALRRKAQLLAQTIAGSIDTSHGDVHQLRNLLCRQIEPEQCAQTQIAGSQVRELLFQVSEEVLVDAVKIGLEHVPVLFIRNHILVDH